MIDRCDKLRIANAVSQLDSDEVGDVAVQILESAQYCKVWMSINIDLEQK